MALTLIIGNKNYSSWSMRPWVLMRECGIPFSEVMLKFESADWRDNIARLSPSKMVPVLWEGEPGAGGSLAIWETIAIIEYLAEHFPDAGVWPRDPKARAMARSIVAEMHAGFRSVRNNMPMNIRASFPGFGLAPGVQSDIARIERIWRDARAAFAGDKPFLFGAFSAADAMFAPVVMRFATYTPAIAADTAAYCEAVKASSGVSQWIADSCAETDYVGMDEPYV